MKGERVGEGERVERLKYCVANIKDVQNRYVFQKPVIRYTYVNSNGDGENSRLHTGNIQHSLTKDLLMKIYKNFLLKFFFSGK